MALNPADCNLFSSFMLVNDSLFVLCKLLAFLLVGMHLCLIR